MLLDGNRRILRHAVITFFIMAILAADASWLVYTLIQRINNRYLPMIVVRPLSSHGTNDVRITRLLGIPSALTFDFEEKKIYWSVITGEDENPWAIQRANIDGTDIETVFQRGESVIFGIAFDWITKTIYYASRWQIGACNPKFCAILVRDHKYAPFKIALHPQSGTMVWTNSDVKSEVFKASMDGSNAMRITAQENALLGCIAIDHDLRRLHWVNLYTETIYSSDFYGANISSLESIGNTSIQASSFVIGGQDIYWLDGMDDSIKQCNKTDGSSFSVQQKGLGVDKLLYTFYDMAFIGEGSQPKNRVNHCANHSCAYICVLTETSFRCMCPDGLNLSQNGEQCEDIGPKILITTSAGLHILCMTTRKITTLSNSSSSWGLTYDFKNSKVYWAGGRSGSTIFRSNLDGSDIESVVTIAEGNEVTGLAYDWIAHNIYYTNGNHVGVCDRSGRSCAVLHRDIRNPPHRIAIFPRAGLMFWTTQGRYGTIMCAFMDGLSAELKLLAVTFYSTLVIDNKGSQLIRLHDSEIEASRFNMQDINSFSPKMENLKSIAISEGLLYWTNDEMIESAYQSNLQRSEIVKTFNWNESVFEMKLIHREGQLHDRVNHCAGGLCSHICVLTQMYFKCICPTGMLLKADARTCARLSRTALRNRTKDVASVNITSVIFNPEDDNGGQFGYRPSCKQWLCADATCVDLEQVCNGIQECPDGTDEGRYCDIPCNEVSYEGKNCKSTPNGPQILCPQGFQLAVDGATCEDINECFESTCEKYCINTNGSFECQDYPTVSDSLGVTLAAVIPSIVAIALVGIALFFGVKYIQTRKLLRRLTPEEVQEFLEGDEKAASSVDCGNEKAMLVPFRLVIKPDDIVIAKDIILGSGQFGIVYRGFYEAEAVAVKTFKRTVEIDEFKAVLAEAKIMAYIGHHVNIVRFIGADVSKISDRKLVLVTELSPHGDLLGYVRKMDPTQWELPNDNSNGGSTTPRVLVSWCEQIACGMQHLEAMKIVHGDLAARNVLVFKENIVKITDFGLSKQLYGNSEYLIKRQRMLPWKWSAIELLTRREFSTDSDIWAFGVTAWEILSLGRQPYDELALGMGFIKYLEQGNRLPKPTYATSGIYKALQECWSAERSCRPSFAVMREFFHNEFMSTGIDNPVANSTGSHTDCGYVHAC